MSWSDTQPRSGRVSAGTRLNGIYEIERQIGAGGMGEVYKGHAIQTGDPVAIKMMLGELVENESALALFRKEASALHYLQHEAIVRYYVFTVEPVLQRPYLAMEFVDGRSLHDILQEAPLPFEAVRALMQRLASGLQAAHDRGIIHRDVSPDNIIIPDGDVRRAKIIDFGIARSTHLGQATVIGSGFAGKYNYVSPEQLGLFGGEVTGQSDIYSLGLVLYEALTGRPIDMGGSQVDIVEKRRRVPDLGAVDMRFRPLLERMLRPNPKDRPESMTAVATWPLGSSQRRFGLGVLPSSSAEPSSEVPGGRPTWHYAAAAVLLVAIVGSGAFATYRYATRPAEPALPPDPSFDSGGGSTQPAAANRTERIKQFVEQYDGGECFFVTPLAIGESAATLEGFGASTRPFEALDSAFRRDQGFEPSIGVRQVTPAQCPAITFLNRLRGERARAPRLQIDSVRVQNGETLSGAIEGVDNRNVELVIVSDGGTVQNISQLLKPGIDGKTFSIGMRRGGLSGSQPQLLVAVATPRPLESLRPAGPREAGQFFTSVLAEAARSGQGISAAARYFKLEQ
ncbi:MAG TPA: serine/threonine-protein kinase [Xanthobacteraceae bacterium]|nr:serine/threonine-protein kinase [Xanthobacteraceae bacterium]